MTRIVGLLIALAAGVALTGIGLGLLMPQLPPEYRTPRLVAPATIVLVAACVGAAWIATRPRRS